MNTQEIKKVLELSREASGEAGLRLLQTFLENYILKSELERLSEPKLVGKAEPSEQSNGQERKPKFKVGDKVRVKDDVLQSEMYNGELYYDIFLPKTEVGTIREVDHNELHNYCYKIQETNYWIGEDALELVLETF